MIDLFADYTNPLDEKWAPSFKAGNHKWNLIASANIEQGLTRMQSDLNVVYFSEFIPNGIDLNVDTQFNWQGDGYFYFLLLSGTDRGAWAKAKYSLVSIN